MKKMNNQGFTIFELILSILISSIVISILIQMLTMSVQARNDVQVDSRIKDEAYLLVEQIKWNAFEMKTQSVEYLETPLSITVTFNHDYDYIIEPNGTIAPDFTTAFSEVLVYNKETEEITYQGSPLHSTNVIYEAGTRFDVTPVDGTCVPTAQKCEDVILTIILYVTIELENGSRLDTQVFETTIVI